jgi:hypothetical protein
MFCKCFLPWQTSFDIGKRGVIRSTGRRQADIFVSACQNFTLPQVFLTIRVLRPTRNRHRKLVNTGLNFFGGAQHVSLETSLIGARHMALSVAMEFQRAEVLGGLFGGGKACGAFSSPRCTKIRLYKAVHKHGNIQAAYLSDGFW